MMSTKGRARSLPLLLWVGNLNILFFGIAVNPLCDKSWIGLAVLLIFVNASYLLGARGWVSRAEQALARKEAMKNWLLAFSSLVIFAGGIEGVAWVVSKAGFVQCYSAMKTMQPTIDQDHRLAHITADTFREPDPVLLWRPVARSPYTRQRFKGPLVDPDASAGVFRVICYGDSNTDGPRRGSWPEQLQELLSHRQSDQDEMFEVLNAGVAGYSSYQGLLRFRSEVEGFHPDLVLVSFGWNDGARTRGLRDSAYEPPAVWRIWLERALLKYRAYRVARHYLLTASPQEHAAQLQSPRVTLEEYRDNLIGFVSTGEDHATSVVLLTRPHRQSEDELRALEPSWMATIPLYNQCLRRLARERAVEMIDVQEHFSTLPQLFADECHFTLAGHEEMARFVYQHIASIIAGGQTTVDDKGPVGRRTADLDVTTRSLDLQSRE